MCPFGTLETIVGLRVMAMAIILSAVLCAAADADIISSGKARCVIVLPDDATSGESFAAKELRDHLKQMTGVGLECVAESRYTKSMGSFISVGWTRLSRDYVDAPRLAAMGDDGCSVFAKDGNLFLAGGRRWGAMYGVYDYLESLGVRWYSPDYTVIPKLTRVGVPDKPFQHKPPFWYRYQWWNNGATPEWLARMRINGNNGQGPTPTESMGGTITARHGCHSYAILIPPEEHFSKHPEWFAIKEDGKRSQGEYCLTNRELREFTAQKVLDDLRACGGKIDNYWVSQNDGGGSGCFCDRCTAERAAHGGKDRWSVNTISFAAFVAGKVRQEFPKVRIKTLAYSYTKAAPENLTVPDNVLVEICGNFSDKEPAHADTVRAWSKVARNISVYTYGGSNYGYWWPCPNLWEVGMQYPWARECGVTAFYVQGTAIGKGAGMTDLRAYLSARMAWDPSRDVRAEICEFCNGFYGPGSTHVLEYLNWYPAYIRQHKMDMNAPAVWGDAEAWRKWVTREAMDHADGLFRKALAATKDNPVYYNHVRRAYLEVLWGGIMVNVKPGGQLTDKELALLPDADADAVRAKAKLFGEIMRENGYDRQSEVVSFDAASYPH